MSEGVLRKAESAAKAAAERKRRSAQGVEIAGAISKDRLADEDDLYATKWFDYRFMTPVDATALFIDTYSRWYRQKWRANFDAKEAEKKTGLLGGKGDETERRREYTSFWGARQRADALGLPYEFFIDHAMEAHLRNGYTKVPRPNQLVEGKTQAQVASYLIERWADCRSASPVFAELPQYKNEAFCNHPAQVSQHEWVIENLGCHPFAIGKACFVRRILPEDKAIAAFGIEVVRSARDAVAGEVGPAMVLVSKMDLMPSCFASPFAYDLADSICPACPFGVPCAKAESLVRNKIAAKFASTEPVAARRREQDAARQRKSRALKKTKALATGGDS